MTPDATVPPAAPRGAAGRVVAVQHQARLSLWVACAFLVAALLATVVPHHTGPWLALHLFFAGALLSAISGASQLFAVTWSAGEAPPSWAATTQRSILVGGVLGLVVARELDLPNALVVSSGVSIVIALVILGAMLWFTVAHGVQRRFDTSRRFYLTAIAFGVVACALGILLATGALGAPRNQLREVHASLNLLGLVGLTVAGTLPFFAATQARVKMSPRVTPGYQHAAWFVLTSALGIAAMGFYVGSRVVAAVGLFAYAVGVLMVAAALPRVGTKQIRWAGPRLIQLLAGIAWWTGAVVAAGVAVSADSTGFSGRVVFVLTVGAYAQILVASLAYLGPVLRAGGHLQLSAGFALTRSWFGLAAANTAVVVYLLGWRRVAMVLLAVWGADTAWRAARLALARSQRGHEAP